MPLRRLGDLQVSALGFGAMTLTQVPGYDVERGVRAVHAALDAGITLFDTADVYGPTGGYGVNEAALIAALRSWPGSLEQVVVATKGGHTRPGETTWWIDGSPEHLRRACEASLRRLGFDALPLYQHHRPDPQRPYADSMQALRDLYDDGLVRRVGISNANVTQIREAAAILGDALVSVQNEYSPVARTSEAEIALCEELGLAFLAWGPLGGMREAKALGSAMAAFTDVAAARGVSPQRIALAWALARSPAVIPIPGASRPESVQDSVPATELVLAEAELAALDGVAAR
ncbi:aldo/keto reductase [Streptomyces sp. NPDC057580]|uniref:aldo/keto reductase n=1 Tax=Streptomyces sp. NPDC057580 TaxID=3346173 RepID=UPI0036B3CEA5